MVKQAYPDILEIAKTLPLWWDDNGTPRFKPFHPDLVPNIYATEAVLFVIACQSCAQEYCVSLCACADGHKRHEIRKLITTCHLHYGDPPQACDDKTCAAGYTMNSVPRRVLQYWRTATGLPYKWRRESQYELADITPDWARDIA